AHSLAYLVWRTMHAESARIAHRRVGLRVVFHEGRGKSMRQERRDAADGARHAFDIHERDVVLGRGVELQDLRNAKPFLEAVPNVRSQPVAATHSDLV